MIETTALGIAVPTLWELSGSQNATGMYVLKARPAGHAGKTTRCHHAAIASHDVSGGIQMDSGNDDDTDDDDDVTSIAATMS